MHARIKLHTLIAHPLRTFKGFPRRETMSGRASALQRPRRLRCNDRLPGAAVCRAGRFYFDCIKALRPYLRPTGIFVCVCVCSNNVLAFFVCTCRLTCVHAHIACDTDCSVANVALPRGDCSLPLSCLMNMWLVSVVASGLAGAVPHPQLLVFHFWLCTIVVAAYILRKT